MEEIYIYIYQISCKTISILSLITEIIRGVCPEEWSLILTSYPLNKEWEIII